MKDPKRVAAAKKAWVTMRARRGVTPAEPPKSTAQAQPMTPAPTAKARTITLTLKLPPNAKLEVLDEDQQIVTTL